MTNKLYYKVPNTEIRNALEGLAYHIADANYINERFGSSDPEYIVANKNVHLSFETLDRLGVPFWVQNSVITYAENWRRYKSEYIDNWLLKHRNIDLKIA